MSEHLCFDCCKLMSTFQFIEIDTYKLMTDQKLRQGLVYGTIVTHRKLHKLSTFVKCGKVEKMLKQDIIERNVMFKRLVLSNYGLKYDKKKKDAEIISGPASNQMTTDLSPSLRVLENQLVDLFSGQLLQRLMKALQVLEEHMCNGQCEECMHTFKNSILKTCSTCQTGKKVAAGASEQAPILVYEIDSYRQCRRCTSVAASKG